MLDDGFFGTSPRETILSLNDKHFIAIIETFKDFDFVTKIYQIISSRRYASGIRRKIYPAYPVGSNARYVLGKLNASLNGLIDKG